MRYLTCFYISSCSFYRNGKCARYFEFPKQQMSFRTYLKITSRLLLKENWILALKTVRRWKNALFIFLYWTGTLSKLVMCSIFSIVFENTVLIIMQNKISIRNLKRTYFFDQNNAKKISTHQCPFISLPFRKLANKWNRLQVFANSSTSRKAW